MDPKQPESSSGFGSTADQRVNQEGEDSTSDSATLSGLAATLAAQQSRVAEIERSLVERIADVDDDRRRSAVLQQRARQGQDEQIEQRLRQHKQSLRWSLLALVVLVIVGFVGLYWQIESSRKPLLARIAALQQTAPSPPEIDALAQLDADATNLAVRIKSLSTSIAALDDQTARALSALDSRLEALDASTSTLAGQINGVNERLSQQETAIQALAIAANGPPNTPSTASPQDSKHRPSTPPKYGADTADQVAIVDEAPYGLQIIGYFDLPQLRRFAATHAPKDRLYSLEETYQGRPWYVLVYSLHASYAEALEARSNLPEELLTLKPLIRRLPVGTRLDLLISQADKDHL